MNIDKIKWCLCQKRGLKLISQNINLSKAYMAEADLTLENVVIAKGKWKTITSYYACYNALYALLMKCGIKSEIHDCTIALMSIIGFTEHEIKFMEDLKDKRINTQHYLKNIVFDKTTEVKSFTLSCKVMSNELNQKKIDDIRREIMELIKP